MSTAGSLGVEGIMGKIQRRGRERKDALTQAKEEVFMLSGETSSAKRPKTEGFQKGEAVGRRTHSSEKKPLTPRKLGEEGGN